jgi:hypothetical protein
MFIRRFPVQRQLAMKGIAVRGCIAKTEWNGPSKGQRYANYTFRNANNDEVEIGSCPSDYIFLQTAIGLCLIGIPVAWFCVRYIKSQLYETKGMSLAVLAIATLTLAAAAAVAGLIPAQRAASTNPSQALRTE